MIRSIQEGNILQMVLEATAPATGGEFFRVLMRKIASALDVRRVFVTECMDDPPTRVHTVAYWRETEFREDVEFDLEGTPCDEVIKGGNVCVHPHSVGKLFPDDKGIAGMEGYIGIPIFDGSGSKVLGHIAILDSKHIGDELVIESVFRIFALRAGAELQRMRSEHALQESEEKYRLIVDNQTDLVVKLDMDGKFLFVSPSYCAMFAKGNDRLLGTTFPLLKDQHDRIGADTAWSKLFTSPHRHNFDERTMTAHGWRCISWEAKAILDEFSNVTKVVAVGRDITEQRRSEEQDRQHVNELAHVTRLSSMSEMGSALAHELNQPLASILSYSKACQRLSSVESCDMTELRAALERIAKNAERAGNIMRHIRDFVRKDVSQRTAVSVNYLVREVCGLANMEARHSDIALTLDLDEDIRPIEVDNIQIQQVILNLVRNGMDSINAGSSAKRNVLTKTACRPDHSVEIVISDTGLGIAPEIAESLFEPFVTTKKKGMGIGLSISRSIVEAHGGRVSADSNSDGGATFRIILPATGENDASVT